MVLLQPGLGIMPYIKCCSSIVCLYMYVRIFAYISIHTYIYIYIEREREREKERALSTIYV